APVAAPRPGDLTPDPDRWRVLLPGATGVQPRAPLYDPYNPNVLKGDYPIIGDKLFLQIIGVLDMFLDQKRNLDFSSRIKNVPFHEDNTLGQITALLSIELFHGDTVFAPKDWAIRVSPIWRFRCGDDNAADNVCDDFITLFEAFGEVKLFEIGDTFDPTSLRLGLQVFNADFFGFVYNDVQPGARLFSEIARNQFKVNLAFFDRLQKDAVTALNDFERREHQVGVATFQWDDFIFPGFNILPVFVVNHDEGVAGKALDAYYLGLTTNGRLGRFNVNSAFYYVFGDTAQNTPNKQSQDISAGMGFVQVTYPVRFWNPRIAVVYATGDGDPNDSRAHGFDSVFDTVNFGGGQFSYLFGEKIQLGATTLFRGNSVLPSLRGANATSQFVNPGVLAVNVGVDLALTAKTILEANYNYVRFDDTSSLEALTKQKDVSSEVGHEFNVGLTYRPFLNEQVILFAGGAVFFPGQGIEDTFGSNDPVWKAIIRAILTF
ncbi:MAG: hypothetical protein ACRELA_18035, partial [Candidatus Rokuibacteriota bacterium]